MGVPLHNELKQNRRQQNVQSTIPIIASTKKIPEESKKVKRSITLSKRLHLEAIRVDWQRKVDRSLEVDFKPG